MKADAESKPYTNERVYCDEESNAYFGKIIWAPKKSLWISAMYMVAIWGGVATFTWQNFFGFLGFTAFTLCFGHSLGMHRRFIHHSYECPKWLEYFLVHLGVLVGIAGPLGMMKAHDMRDWAQRQKQCHPFYGQQEKWWVDWYWQLHCDVALLNSPEFKPEKEVAEDKVYQWMEETWMWQQLPWAIVFYLVGGVEWIIWGIAMRVAISVTGHWLIGYLAHNKGHRDYHVKDASVQGYNILFCSLLTMGESWHNNHHAYPNSALMGIEKGQLDPGWWMLRIFEYFGLVWCLKRPEDLPARPELLPVFPQSKAALHNGFDYREIT